MNEFENLCLNELKQAIANEKIEYIIIDEIGPMQLFSTEYKKLLYQLLNSPKPILGTIFYSSHEWLDVFKKEPNVKLVEITLENRDTLPLDIVEAVSKNDPTFQRKINKAKRYIEEKERFKIEDNTITIYSTHGVRTVECRGSGYICDCEYFKENNTCSHIISVINLNNNSTVLEGSLKR